MGVTITRVGIPVATGKTSKFVAINPNECIFKFNREDYDIVRIENSSGSAAIVVDTDITTELAVNDGIYFTSSKYTVTSSTIKSYSYDSGADETTIVINTNYAGADDTASGKYINLIDGRPNFKIQVRVFNADTLAPIVTIPAREPFTNGELKVNVSAFLRSQLSLAPEVDYSLVHSPNTNNSIPFFLKYQVSYGSTTETEVNDYPNIYTAVGAAQQIGAKHGANLGEFVSFHNPSFGSIPKGKWMTSFERPTYWNNYPFGIGFCFQDEGHGSVDMKRAIEQLDINGSPVSLAFTSMDETKMNYANHVNLSGKYTANTDSINLWIETGATVSQCSVLGTGSENAFDLDDWILDGSNNLLGIKVDANATYVTSIDSRPNGKLYNEVGTEMDTLTWDAVDSRYEPSGTHNINVAGWYAVISGISVTLAPAYAGEACANQTFYQVSAGAANLAPTLSSLAISGDLDIEGTLTASYIYFDNESDLQDVGSTTEGFYSYSDAAGTLNRTFLGSGKTLNLNSSHLGKYIRFESTPATLTGTSPGIKYESGVYGPVVAVESFTFQTNFDPATDGTFDPIITYTGAGTPKWVFEDSSVITGSVVSTSANGLDGTTQDVVLKVQDLSQITRFAASNDKLVGSFDSSPLTGLDILELSDNNITGLTFSSSQDFGTTVDISGNTSLSIAGSHFAVPAFTNCNFDASEITITGTLIVKAGSSFVDFQLRSVSSITGVDISNATFNGGTSKEIDIALCSTCTAITLPASGGGTIGDMRANGTAITTLDLSGIEFTRNILLQDCTSLATIDYGEQSNQINLIYAYDCTALTSRQDVSGFTYLPNYLRYDNSPITGIDLPVASNAMSTGITAKGCNISTITNLDLCTNISDVDNFNLDLRDNSMSDTEVDSILSDMSANSSPGYSLRTVKLEGTNAAPTVAGDADAVILSDDGFAVTTTP